MSVGTDLNIANVPGQTAWPDYVSLPPADAVAILAAASASHVVRIPLLATTATTGGAVLSWANPELGSIIITRVIIDVTTKSTGAATLAIGSTATSATTSANNLLDAVDVGTAAGTFDNITEKGTAGKSRQKLAAGKWVTATGSATTAGLVGFLYIEYFEI